MAFNTFNIMYSLVNLLKTAMSNGKLKKNEVIDFASNISNIFNKMSNRFYKYADDMLAVCSMLNGVDIFSIFFMLVRIQSRKVVINAPLEKSTFSRQ